VRLPAAVIAILVALAGVAGAGGSVAPAHAYDPATTHAGLTERAAESSGLHRVLTRRLLRPLGLLETVALHPARLPGVQRHRLLARLATLDPAGGYRPSDDSTASALSWLVAGSVIAGTPPERGRHHFFDPARNRGLDNTGGLSDFYHSLKISLDGGGTLRGFATGANFDLTGDAAPAWLASPANEQGVPALLRHWEDAVAASEPALRDAALAQALLALGGILAVVEDLGDPAHVRNDFRGAYLDSQSRSAFDRGSSYERFVADAYGRIGVPAAAAPVRRPTLQAYLSAPDGQGLADRTQRRFFSEGTIPPDGIVDRGTTTKDVVDAARESLIYPQPRVGRLALQTVGRTQYLRQEGRRVLGYRRAPGRVRFFLDNAVHQDTARALLPEIGAYAAGIVDHLLRGELQLEAVEGGVRVSVMGLPIRNGKIRVFFEDADGIRREVTTPSTDGASAGAGAGGVVAIAVPKDVKRVAAVLRGEDDAGALVAIGELRMK